MSAVFKGAIAGGALVLGTSLLFVTNKGWHRLEGRPPSLTFNRDIQPILAAHCYHCHGPDKGSRKAGLRLDIPDHVFEKTAKSGVFPIVKGDPDASEIIRRMTAHDQDEVMPPVDAPEKAVPAKQVTLLKEWIRQGAKYQPHWAFVPPVRPASPEVSNPSWCRNEIDRFVMKKLDEEGLKPSPEAEKRTLARRVFLDLTGLPPKPEEVDAYVADSSPDAYEKMVDRLLASPAFGEHRARYWLDVVRYGDTHGLHKDNYHSIWPYRDYVIRSFNENKPFDRFIMEQVAGDLLPAENLDQLIATGFNRTHISSGEGGTIIEELRVNTRRERVEGIGAAFLGLTLQCAVCHDHKFDPTSQKDFYQLAATFGNTTDKGSNDDQPNPPPVVRVPDDPAALARANEVLKEKAAVERALRDRRYQDHQLVADWLAREEALRSAPSDGPDAHFPFNEGKGQAVRDVVTGKTYEMEGPAPSWNEDILFWPTFRLESNTRLPVPDAGDYESDRPFSVAGWFRLPSIPSELGVSTAGALISRMESPGSDEEESSASDGDTGEKTGKKNNVPGQGWNLFYEGAPRKSRSRDYILRRMQKNIYGVVLVELAGENPEHSLRIRGTEQFARGKWMHIAFSYDGSGKAEGVKLYIDGKPAPVEVLSDSLQGSIRTAAPLHFGRRHDSHPMQELAFQDVRIYGRAMSAREVESLATGERLAAELLQSKPPEEWSPDEKKMVEDFYHAHVDDTSKELEEKRRLLLAKFEKETENGAETLVVEESARMPLGHVLSRGVYSARDERVYPNTPKVLPAWPEDAPRNRLGFAQWLVMPEQPLVPRVVVNRFWQEVFGTGLVETVEDFGIVGERPSHPELLDWLAVEFRESGWDVKHLFKLMVTSSAYRQSAKVTPELYERDPKNRLLARGPRFRMDGEVLRDMALAASDLLADRIGGPPVKPYQPEDVWETGTYPRSTTRFYRQDEGESLHRRSLYSFWKRMAILPNMEAFDAPSREVACPRRQRTNTPLQALVTMNDPQFVESARVMAQTLLKEGPADTQDRMDWIARRLISRSMSGEEREILGRSQQSLRAIYEEHPELAGKFASVGAVPVDPDLNPAELAVWTVTASQIMNLDETLNK